MKAFVALGSIACSAMYFFYGTNIYFGLSFFLLATVGFAGSLVYYNSYLPDIATPDNLTNSLPKALHLAILGVLPF